MKPTRVNCSLSSRQGAVHFRGFILIIEIIKLLFGIVGDWATGKYTEIPTGAIIAIIGLLYFVSPIDLIPDFLPRGLIDDAVVLGLMQ